MSKNSKKTKRIDVAIVVGSTGDLATLQETERVLEDFKVPYKITIGSAHRTPDAVRHFVKRSEALGAKVFIAASGGAAALPGVVAAETTCPVIGIPMDTPSLAGLDSLLSIVQMPGGVPVATVAIGKAGAKNAALLAIQILATRDAKYQASLAVFRKQMSAKILNDAKTVSRARTQILDFK